MSDLIDSLRDRAQKCANITDGLWLERAADEIAYMRSVFAKSHESKPTTDMATIIKAAFGDKAYAPAQDNIPSFLSPTSADYADLLADGSPTPATDKGDGRDAWQPIDTAPKDGRMFLGWVDAVRYGESDEGRAFETNVSEHDFCRWNEHHGYFENMMGQIGDAYHVTHWQPLPAPPAALSQKAGE
jgi:hypothetical protein